MPRASQHFTKSSPSPVTAGRALARPAQGRPGRPQPREAPAPLAGHVASDLGVESSSPAVGALGLPAHSRVCSFGRARSQGWGHLCIASGRRPLRSLLCLAPHNPGHPTAHSSPQSAASRIPQHPTASQTPEHPTSRSIPQPWPTPQPTPPGLLPGLGVPGLLPTWPGGVCVWGGCLASSLSRSAWPGLAGNDTSPIWPRSPALTSGLCQVQGHLSRRAADPEPGGRRLPGCSRRVPSPPPPPPHWAPGLRSLIYLSARVPVLSLKARLQNGRLLTP